MPATNEQVQRYVNERVRVRSEQIRALIGSMEDDKATIDDVYANLTNNPTWVDSRTDGPPHLLTPSDVLAWNAFITDTLTSILNSPQLSVVLKSCVRPI